jgi:hypothetical protein
MRVIGTVALYNPKCIPFLVANRKQVLPCMSKGTCLHYRFQGAEGQPLDMTQEKWVELPFEGIARPGGAARSLSVEAADRVGSWLLAQPKPAA